MLNIIWSKKSNYNTKIQIDGNGEKDFYFDCDQNKWSQRISTFARQQEIKLKDYIIRYRQEKNADAAA